MKRLTYTLEATDEIIYGKNNSNDPIQFDREVLQALEFLSSGIVSGQTTGIGGHRQWILPRLPYSVIYHESDDEVRIIAFAHHKRKPGYWKRRLKP